MLSSLRAGRHAGVLKATFIVRLRVMRHSRGYGFDEENY